MAGGRQTRHFREEKGVINEAGKKKISSKEKIPIGKQSGRKGRKTKAYNREKKKGDSKIPFTKKKKEYPPWVGAVCAPCTKERRQKRGGGGKERDPS